MGIRYAFEVGILRFIVAMEFVHKVRWWNIWVETNSTFVVLVFKEKKSHLVPWEICIRWMEALRFALVCTGWIERVGTSNPTQPEHIELKKNKPNPTVQTNLTQPNQIIQPNQIMIVLGWVGLIRLDI